MAYRRLEGSKADVRTVSGICAQCAQIVMIKDLLGSSMVLLCEHGNGKFSLKTGLRMAYRLLGQLQAMH